MNPLADELNQILADSIANSLLSDFGRRLYFPKGIVAQTDEAKQKAHHFNATVGMAFQNGDVLHLPAIKKYIPELTNREIFAYSTTAGEPGLRQAWLGEIRSKNPALGRTPLLLPIVTSGITNGLVTIADIFIDEGDTVILPDMYWGNYRLILQERRKANLLHFSFFNDEGRFNLQGLKALIALQPENSAIRLLFNFPNNPTGYSLSTAEVESLVTFINNQADLGKKFLIMTDDAYFDLFFEEETYKQSLFTPFAGLHPNILAVKLDGATKENTAWGFRIGFITLGAAGLQQHHYEALEKKIKGALRSSISSCSILGQSLLLRAMTAKSYKAEKQTNRHTIHLKYQAAKSVLSELSMPKGLSCLPFNSGYFMCFKWETGSTEVLRRHLLNELGIGTIAIGEEYLRVAFASIDPENIRELFEMIIKTVRDIG